MELIKATYTVLLILSLATSPISVPIQAVIHKMMYGRPYLATIYYCGIQSMVYNFNVTILFGILHISLLLSKDSVNSGEVPGVIISLAFGLLFNRLFFKFFTRKLNEWSDGIRKQKRNEYASDAVTVTDLNDD